jgi:hypothetical protein
MFIIVRLYKYKNLYFLVPTLFLIVQVLVNNPMSIELKDSHLLSNILKNIQHIDELLGHVLFSEDKYLEEV